MKPIELEISAWGPYKQLEVVQFDKLRERGLFLVTGPTGAGKTTIFDAISFALFGNLSGQMREKNSVRSDFAERDTKTYVKLKFAHKGQLYEVYRNPEYLRPKKKKSGGEEYTKERENAILTVSQDVRIEGNLEVTKKIEEILSMDYVRFKQISMIAQGEFAKLLTESSGEKTKIFRNLFGTKIVEAFAVSLRTKANALYKEVMEYRHRMDEDVKMLHEDSAQWQEILENPDRNYETVFSYLAERRKSYQEEKKQADKAYERADREERELALKYAEWKRAKETEERLKKQEELLRLHKEKKAQYEAKEQEVSRIRNAQRVEPFYVHFLNGKEQKNKLEAAMRAAKTEAQKLEERMRENAFFHENKETVLALSSMEEEKKTWEEERDNKLLSFKKKQETLAKMKEDYLTAEKCVQESREELEQAESSYRRSAIGIVTKMLKRGEPCPVCGSTEHPNPAKVSGEQVDEEVLKKLKERYDTLHEKQLLVHEQAMRVQMESESLKTEVKKAEETLEKIGLQEKKQWEQIKQQSRNRKEIEEFLAKIGIDKKNEIEERCLAYEKAQVLLGEKTAEEERVSKELTEVSEKMTELTNAYLQAISENELTDEATFLYYRERKEEEDSLREECLQYKEELQRLTETVKHLRAETDSYTILREETGKSGEWEEKLKVYAAEKKKINQEREAKGQRLSEIKKITQALTKKQENQTRLSREYGIIKDLDNLASGNNSKRLVFEQYVLSAYFEQVLLAANVRFEKMTAGRYEMFRGEEVMDGRKKDSMEICVMDYYTGKSRPVKTLSGGETFKASLALALGLSDVIGRSNGGLRVETLFIDEGFGALDSESLEQACETLTSLVEKDRLIGIISHVPQLREKIDNQIIIHKTSSGSRIENVIG